MPAAHTLSSAPLPRSILPLHLQARQQQRKRDSCIPYNSKDEQLQQIILLHLSPIRSHCRTMRSPDLLFILISSRSSSSSPFPSSTCQVNRKSASPAAPKTQQPTHVPAPVKQPSSGTHGCVGEIQPLVHPAHSTPSKAKHVCGNSVANPVTMPQLTLKASPDHCPLQCNTKICLLLAHLYTH